MANIIQQLEDLKEWGQDPTRYARRLEFRSTIPYGEVIDEDFDELSTREDEYYRKGPWKTSREDYRKGQLVQPGPGRPGYEGRDFKKNPPWNKGLSDPSKFRYTSSGKKVYKSTSARTLAMDSTTVPFYSEGKQMWGIRQSWRGGKKQPVVWKKKKSDINKFIKKQAEEAQYRIDTARTTGQAKRVANENKYRKSLENWTDNWFKQNKFDDVRGIDKGINKFKKDFAKAKIVKPGNVVRAAAVEGFPNIPDAGKQALTRSKIKGGFQNSYYRKRFLNNVLDNNPLLEKRVNQYFKYISQDKGTLKAIQEGGYESLQAMRVAHDDMFKNIDDIMFLLSQEDTGLYGQGKYDFLNNRFKNYSAYSKKVNQSGITYLNNIKKIEDTLGPSKLKQLLNGETSIIKFMIKQQKDLAEVFDVKALPSELRFSLDHNIGVADISRMNKSQMEKYINSYIGTTVKRNTQLGLRGFAATKPKLIKNINAGINVKENLAKLNKITKTAYPETLGKNPYKILSGKVEATKSFTFPKTQEKLFTDYFREIAKTKKGATAMTEQMATNPKLVNLIEKGWGPKEFNKFRKFTKQNPKLAKQASMALYSGIPIDEIMKMPGMKKAMPWIKGEGYFALADMLNNWSKGQSFLKGAGKGVEMATFGLVDFDTDEKALLMHALKKGVPKNEIKAMMNYLKYKKEEKKLTGLDTSLAALDYHESIGGELSPAHMMNPEEGWNYGDREMLNKRIAKSEKNLDKAFNEYYAGDNRSATIGMVTLENMMESLTAEEWNKTAGIPLVDRGYREMIGAKADEGMVWGPLFGGGMRESLEKLGWGEETDSLKSFKPQELMSAHPVYGYKEQIRDMESRGISPMEDIRMSLGYALPPQNYAGGGIAGIRRPNAIPPESGPMPQGGGLSTMFNRVKPW